MSSWIISVEKFTSSSTASGNDPYGNSVSLWFQQLKANIFYVDLFPTIEENPYGISNINTLLN